MTYPYSGPPSGPQPYPPYGQPGFGGVPPYPPYPGGFGGQPQLADWGYRLLGYLIDSAIPGLAAGIVYLLWHILIVGILATNMTGGDGEATDVSPAVVVIAILVLVVVAVLIVGFNIWNRAYRRGTTGQTLGQKVVKIKTVDEFTGQPIGFGMAFVRELCHVLDSLFGCFPLGFLWPLWDDRRQTWADKLVKTVVVHADPAVPHGPAPYQQPMPPGPPPGYPNPGQPYGPPPQPPYPG